MYRLKRGLIVSCQAGKGEPLYGYSIMHLFAKAAVAGGAVGIRALSEDVQMIRSVVDVPIIGLTKNDYDDSEVYITSTLAEVRELLKTDCDVIAMDATPRFRHGGERLEDLVRCIRREDPAREIMADVATAEDVKNAIALGFDYVSTTLRGYTVDTHGAVLPDIAFMREARALTEGTKTRMVAEGGIQDLGQMREVGRLDPYAIVVGSAITRPKLITERFVSALGKDPE